MIKSFLDDQDNGFVKEFDWKRSLPLRKSKTFIFRDVAMSFRPVIHLKGFIQFCFKMSKSIR